LGLKDVLETKIIRNITKLPITSKIEANLWVEMQKVLKGTVSQDFLLPVFFMNQLPPSPRVSP
jgi:hypothetical protein